MSTTAVPLAHVPDLAAQLWSMTEADGSCWRWVGSFSKYGYGRLHAYGQRRPAHRLAYAAFVGEVPEGAWVLHRCDNKWCINPWHLYPGDHAQNTEDAVARNRFASGERHGLHRHPERIRRGERNPAAKLTAEKVRSIRTHRGAGRTFASLSREFGVTEWAIRLIVQGKTWKHVLPEVA